MRTSDKGIAEIAAHEGIVPYPYRDSRNIWTCGVGHTASAGPPDPAKLPRGVEIPMSEVIAIFRRDLKRFEARVNSAVKVPLAQHEYDACVSFDYNSGGIHKAALTRHLNEGDREAAAKAFMGWSKPPEIIPRRRKEQALFRDGAYSSNGRAAAYTADAAGKVNWASPKSVNVADAMAPKPRPKPEQEPTVAEDRVLTIGSEGALVRALQQELKRLKYHSGEIDGIFGNLTRDSVMAFQADNGLPTDGRVTDDMWDVFKTADVRPTMEKRKDKTLDELAEDGSEIADSAKKGKKGAIATFLAAVGAMISSAFERAGDLVHFGPMFEQVRPYFQEYGIWLFGTALLGLAGFIYWQSRKAGNARLRDHKEARTL